jgi:carbamoyl-phosphate synthase small subunit
MRSAKGRLLLQSGAGFEGELAGCVRPVSGEVVFNTGMVGYPEALTDPSYRGQILVLTYPLIGNYGVAARHQPDCVQEGFESDRVQISALVVSQLSLHHNHWNASTSLCDWLSEEKVPVLCGVDTRALTKQLREHGSMPGAIIVEGRDGRYPEGPIKIDDPNRTNLVEAVSVRQPVFYERGRKKVVLVDCGCKNSILRELLRREVSVLRVPWNYNFLDSDFDGVLISNGPGDPKMCQETVDLVREAMKRKRPIMGICLGNQILALAAGADTYKMKFGHRGHNQPCSQTGTDLCYITSQNHGYAVDERTLPQGWKSWFVNANDHTNEGIRHHRLPFFSVQFHPEGMPGPLDSGFLFDEFISTLSIFRPLGAGATGRMR